MTIDASGFYSKLLVGTVLPLMRKYGYDCAIQVKVGEVFDPVTGLVTQPATYMVFPAYGLNDPAGSTTREAKNLARLKAQNVYLDASLLTIAPNPDDLFQDANGALKEIIKVESIDPGGLVMLWKITVKQ